MPPVPPSRTAHCVHKFGGSSLATAEHILRLRVLIGDGASARTLVVSAMSGTTNALIALAEAAAARRDWRTGWQALRQRHLHAAAVIDPQAVHALGAALEADFSELRAELAALADDDSPAAGHARIHGQGEVISSRLVQAALSGDAPGSWQRLDAREVLVVYAGEMGVEVDWAASRAALARWRAEHPGKDTVITGFIARDREGRQTTLGRNGSDYSAAIFANLLAADELTIWSDVDGVLSADPRLVPDAVVLPTLSYLEACELAYFGAKVLHPQTLAPVQDAGIPLRIRNTLNPAAPGTLISAASSTHPDTPVKGLSLVGGMAVLELAGNGMLGVPGTAERLFAALHAAAVSVTMISQGSSEHSICCIIRSEQAERARAAVAEAFHVNADNAIQAVTVSTGLSILAAVGDGMVGTPGVAARMFAALAHAQVNIRAIAQGASERNISVAVAEADATRALRAAHSAFWLSPKTVSVGIIGPGQVGRALLAQMASVLPTLRANLHIDLRLRSIANRRAMVLEHGSMAPDTAVQHLDAATAQAVDLAAFARHLRAEHTPHALIIDCSGSDAIAGHYPAWLAAGIHIVTSSKHAGSGDWSRWCAVREAQRHSGARFGREATVGAGLPVILTLRNLLDTGDELLAVDGMLSGTLAWLFNSFDGTEPFSALVRQAREMGYTEPDPRDDLSSLDVARKLVILAREAGRELSLADVEVENLVPEALQAVSLDEFLERLDELDPPMQARLDAAKTQGLHLRHIAQLDRDGRASVGVRALPADHACCHTRLTDNLVQFTTQRYCDNPLIVQGPGAGPAVTAAGVFGDVLAIAQGV